jgi:hypothetical protein
MSAVQGAGSAARGCRPERAGAMHEGPHAGDAQQVGVADVAVPASGAAGGSVQRPIAPSCYARAVGWRNADLSLELRHEKMCRDDWRKSSGDPAA